MSIGILYDPLFLEHETGRHPENPERLVAVTRLLRERQLWVRLRHLDFESASFAQLSSVHAGEYLDLIRVTSERGGGRLTPDTPFGARSWKAAASASGAAVRATNAVLDSEVESAFALLRPPGHHACPGEGMGFCLLNHVAVAARHAVNVRGVERVLVVDFDVHHGNGTQEIFYEDPAVLFFSMHQFPAYPGTGAATETGAGEAVGMTINVRIPPLAGDAVHLQVLQEVLIPAARRFQPQLIIVSAGYDSHWRNTAFLNSIRMGVTVRGIAQWVVVLNTLASELCSGKIVFCLEGGYDPEALAWSVDATFRVLLGEDPLDPIGPPPYVPHQEISDVIAACRSIHRLAA